MNMFRYSRVSRLLLALSVVTLSLTGCVTFEQHIPSQTATGQQLTVEALADAKRFREKVGLRADGAWILQVAKDPLSEPGRLAYGIPLLPDELDELERRAQNGQELFKVVEAYGASHADEWSGAYLDVRTGEFVAQFTGSLVEHEAAIRGLVSPSAEVVVKQVRWTYEELRTRQPRITSDIAWFESIGARYTGIGIDVIRNAVVVKVSSGDPNVEEQILDHYDGAGWLLSDSDGIGPWRGGYGSAVLTVLAASGPVGLGLQCDLTSDLPVADPDELIVTGPDGVCRVERLAATGYTVEIKVMAEDGSGWKVVGTGGRLIVQPDLESRVTIQATLP